MHKAFLYIVITALLLSSEAKSQEKLTPEQAKADLSIAFQALREAHPGLYRYNSRASIDSLFASAEKRVSTVRNRQDFYRILVPVISGIGCGHTKLHPDENWQNNYFYGRDHLFPLKLYFTGNQAFVLGSYSDSLIPEGSEILTINYQPVNDIISKLLMCSFSDGKNVTFKYIELGKFFSAYYANILEAPDSFVIQYNDGQTKTVVIPSVTLDQIEQYNHQTELKSERQPYYGTYADSATALLTINSFQMKGDRSFQSVLRKYFKDIRQKKINTLIIDLRDNEGGEDSRGALLLSYLMNKNFRYYDRLEATTDKKFSFSQYARLPKFYGILRMLLSKTDSGTYLWKHHPNLKMQKPSKNHFDGKVFVLINGASFSVTAEFASAAWYNKRVVFIGEETGGGFYGNNSGAFAIVTLPNSRLNIGIPLLAYYMAVRNYPYPNHGVMPDYEIKPSINDLLNGRDPVIDFALGLSGR